MSNEKATLKEKIGFFMVNAGNIPVMTLMNTYLLIYYTDIVGVSPAAVGTLFLISRFADGISDPLMGFIIDKFPKTKFGKYRPILVVGVIACMLNYLLLWFAPVMAQSGKIVIIYVTYLLLGLTFDLMDIPLNSLIPVLTKNPNERNVFSTIKGIAYTLGGTLINIAAPLLIAHYSNSFDGYVILIFGAVAWVLFFSLVGSLFIRERVIETETKEQVESEKYTAKDLIKILKFRPVLVLFAAMLLANTAWALFNSTVMYYVMYNLGNAKIFGNANIISLIGVIPASILIPYFARRFGKKKVFCIALLLLGSLMGLQVITGGAAAIFLASYVLIQASRSMLNTLQYSLSADNVDALQEQLGLRGAAVVASMNSLVAKFSNGIGGAIAGYILSQTGYVANQAQTAGALNGIKISTFILPATFYLIGFIIFQLGFKPAVKKNKVIEVITEEKLSKSLDIEG